MKRLLLLMMLLLAGDVFAHKPSDSYLTLKVVDQHIDGQWDIALRDLDLAVGLDSNGDGALTWDEIRNRHAAIAAYAFSHLKLGTAGRDCTISPGAQLIDQHTDGAYSVLPFRAECAQPIDALEIDYRLLFDLDPQHRGLLNLQRGAQTVTAILSPDHPLQQFNARATSRWMQFFDYVREGIWHIWIGFDHILFLLSLLLPAVLSFDGRRWHGAASFRDALIDVVKIVSAFTLAHSITLTLATLQIIALPSRWIESAIAASVIAAALNNLWPLIRGKRWLVAFGFGLIHGFGFASVLTDLGLPQAALLLALVGFNLGVECGQLAIVALFLPLAYRLRQHWIYRRLLFRNGSILIALIATGWLIERAFNLKIF